MGVAGTCSPPLSLGRVAPDCPLTYERLAAPRRAQGGVLTPVTQPPKSNMTHAWGGASVCWTLIHPFLLLGRRDDSKPRPGGGGRRVSPTNSASRAWSN